MTGPSMLQLGGLSVLLGIAGVLMFGTVHAIAIVPIWARLAGGIPFAIVAALGVTLAFHALYRRDRWSLTLGAGFRFGALCWLAGVPATIFVNVARLVAAPAARPAWVDPASLFVAALTGAAFFGAIGRDWRPALAGAAAIGVLMAMGGGVVPIANGRRPTELWFGFLLTEVVGGAILVFAYRRIVASHHVAYDDEASGGDRRKGPQSGTR